jgi:outer membrane protein OmpU
MNTIKKIGLTALGTTLVASSAFAGEISVSGDAGYTWSSESIGGNAATTTTGSASNDGVGYNHDISFSGSGELDNGWTVATGMTIVEDSSLSSSNVKLTMGSMGSITVGNGTGGIGAAYDGVTPYAYEENHDGMKTSTAIDNMGALLGNGGIDYRSPSIDLGGTGATMSFKYNITPEASGTAVGEGGVATGHATWASGQALGIDIAYGGISIGAFGAEVSRDSLGAVAATTTGNKNEDAFDGTWYAKWSNGPVSIGYQTAYIDRGASGSAAANTGSKYVTTAAGQFESELMSIAFNVNENLSLSWSELEETYDDQSNVNTGTEIADVAMESTSIQFAYTMGSMSIKGYQTDTDNPGWDSDAQSDEVTEIAVNFAF